MENSTKFVLTNFELQDNFGLPDLLKSKYCGIPVGHGTQIGQEVFPLPTWNIMPWTLLNPQSRKNCKKDFKIIS